MLTGQLSRTHWTDMPLVVVSGTQDRFPPARLSETEWKSDSLRIDLSRLSSQGRLVQLDNTSLVVALVRAILRQVR